MKRYLAILFFAFQTTTGIAQPAAPSKAKSLLDSGTKHFQAREYEAALHDFQASYELEPSLLAAASSAHAQANIDPAHPSAVLEWITKGLSNSSNADASTWVELAHACDAARTSTHDTEKARADLLNSKATLEKANADLTARVRELEKRLVTFDSLVPILKSTLATKDWIRVQQLCAGDC